VTAAWTIAAGTKRPNWLPSVARRHSLHRKVSAPAHNRVPFRSPRMADHNIPAPQIIVLPTKNHALPPETETMGSSGQGTLIDRDTSNARRKTTPPQTNTTPQNTPSKLQILLRWQGFILASALTKTLSDAPPRAWGCN